jgi:hypothetical protein
MLTHAAKSSLWASGVAEPCGRAAKSPTPRMKTTGAPQWFEDEVACAQAASTHAQSSRVEVASTTATA